MLSEAGAHVVTLVIGAVNVPSKSNFLSFVVRILILRLGEALSQFCLFPRLDAPLFFPHSNLFLSPAESDGWLST